MRFSAGYTMAVNNRHIDLIDLVTDSSTCAASFHLSFLLDGSFKLPSKIRANTRFEAVILFN
ncbi:hypothetical protein ASF66_11345 [Pseudomonas sp. Leaf129]|nr:hypothetical protein ASF66_11345 [Pseudomonas sp. Leaf129]